MPDGKFNQIVSGIFTSKLIYCITVWGGIWGLPDQSIINRRNTSITKNETRKLQVMQNKVMRLMSGLDYNSSTKTLLKTTKQLRVHQLVAYHTCCQVQKIKLSILPVYHYDRLFINADDKNLKSSRSENKRINFNWIST